MAASTISHKAFNLKSHETGTYAVKIFLRLAAKNFPEGYSFLYNIKKDTHPPGDYTGLENGDGYRVLQVK